MQWLETLLKLRKDTLQSIEKELSLLQSEKNRQESNYNRLRQDALALQLPQKSSGAMISWISMQKRYATQALQAQQQKLAQVHKRIEQTKQRYLEANQEYEQAKYLKADYVKKRAYVQKQKDQKFLDELSSQRFYLDKKRDTL
ncbi:MAG: flagellar export protein FliJ [Campylobacterota bacterium]